jgi:hypothetical protein
MAILTTTVTSKRQVTIPKELDREFPVSPGMRLTWTVENNALAARCVRVISELAGCLKSNLPLPDPATEKAGIRHFKRKYRKV